MSEQRYKTSKTDPMTHLLIHHQPLDESIALHIRSVMKYALPMAPLPLPKDTLTSFKMMTSGHERGTLIVERNGELIGCVMLMKGPSPNLARPMGVVLPAEQRAGVGRQPGIGSSKSSLTTLKEVGQINIHPRANTVVSASEKAALRQRSLHAKSIDKDGTLTCRRASGGHHQSTVKNIFSRYKN